MTMTTISWLLAFMQVQNFAALMSCIIAMLQKHDFGERGELASSTRA